MSVFPRYQSRVNIDVKQLRLKVTVEADTRCGPVVRGEHTVRIRTTDAAETRSATVLATSFAVSAMKKQHDQTVAACKKAGTHERH